MKDRGNYGFIMGGPVIYLATYEHENMRPEGYGLQLVREAADMWSEGADYINKVKGILPNIEVCPWNCENCYETHRPGVGPDGYSGIPSFMGILEMERLCLPVLEDVPDIEFHYFFDLDRGQLVVRVGSINVPDIMDLDFDLKEPGMMAHIETGGAFAEWVHKTYREMLDS